MLTLFYLGALGIRVFLMLGASQTDSGPLLFTVRQSDTHKRRQPISYYRQ